MWEVTRKVKHFDIGFNSKNCQIRGRSQQKERRTVTLVYGFPREPSCFQWKTLPEVHILQAVLN